MSATYLAEAGISYASPAHSGCRQSGLAIDSSARITSRSRRQSVQACFALPSRSSRVDVSLRCVGRHQGDPRARDASTSQESARTRLHRQWIVQFEGIAERSAASRLGSRRSRACQPGLPTLRPANASMSRSFALLRVIHLPERIWGLFRMSNKRRFIERRRLRRQLCPAPVCGNVARTSVPRRFRQPRSSMILSSSSRR